MNTRNIVTAVAVLLPAVAAGCAKSPESIAPAYVSEVPYSQWTCEQLGQEQQRLSSAYTVAAQQQNNARGNDIAGVILIGLPVSSLSGDNIAPQIAQIKGQQDAVRKSMILKNCK